MLLGEFLGGKRGSKIRVVGSEEYQSVSAAHVRNSIVGRSSPFLRDHAGGAEPLDLTHTDPPGARGVCLGQALFKHALDNV